METVETFIAQINADGSLQLPAEYRAQYHLTPGDPLTIIRINGHLIIAPHPLVTVEALDQLNALFAEAQITFEDLMATGYEIRAKLFVEQYGRLAY